jgi:hypothetical protein
MATQTIIPGGRVTAGPIKDGLTSAREVSLYLDPDQKRSIEYTVYLHSISKRSFEQPHTIYRNVVVPACPKDKRYITFFRVNHPVQIPIVDPDNPSGPNLFKFENAKRAALGICNPSFQGTDLAAQDQPIPDWSQISSSESDLTRQGVFASMNEVPTAQELEKADARRLAYYKGIFQRMNELWRADPKNAQQVLGADHHIAAEMFQIDVGWHLMVTPKIDCPQCGERIKEGLAFHYNNGVKCVLDWERAYLAGAVKKDEVPEGREWWDVEKPKRKTGISSAAEELKGV